MAHAQCQASPWHSVGCLCRGGKLSPTALVCEDLHPLWGPGMRVLSVEEAPLPLGVRGALSGVMWPWGSELLMLLWVPFQDPCFVLFFKLS